MDELRVGEQAQESVNAAWARFAEDVAELGETIEKAPFNRDEQTAAAGYPHIARFLATFLAESTDYRDPDYPQFMRLPNSVARIGWENPDNPYLAFAVRGDHSYRLRGNTSNFDLVTINVYSGMLGHTPVSDIRTVSSIASYDLYIDENGDFVLTLTFACAAGTTRQAKQIAAGNRNTPFIPRPARSNLRIQAPAPSGIPGYWR